MAITWYSDDYAEWVRQSRSPGGAVQTQGISVINIHLALIHPLLFLGGIVDQELRMK